METENLILGTAQLGLDYGRGSGKQIAINEANNLLRKATISGISTLDSALSYGNAHNIISSIKNRPKNIITKVSSSFLQQDESNLHSELFKILKKLRQDKFEGVLLHDPIVLTNNNKDILNKFLSIKEKGIASSLGISIYSESDLLSLGDFFKPEIIQCPVNVLDQRLLNSNLLKSFKSQGSKIHARSIFLQGLLLNKSVPAGFPKELNNLFTRIDNFCNQYSLTRLEFCLHFISNYMNIIDKVIVGVDSLKNFEEILYSINKIKTSRIDQSFFEEFSILNGDIIDPRKWQ